MTKKKDIVINIKPFHAQSRVYEKGFTLTFHADIGDDYSRKKIINIKLDRWWVIYLARELKKVLAWEEKELQRITDLTGFKDE